jgi:hypothetical protein
MYEAGYQEEGKNIFDVVVVFRKANLGWEETFGKILNCLKWSFFYTVLHLVPWHDAKHC